MTLHIHIVDSEEVASAYSEIPDSIGVADGFRNNKKHITIYYDGVSVVILDSMESALLEIARRYIL